jgi:hypothetical protein
MMDTKIAIRGVSAAVIGARHLRSARNGQDAAALWVGDQAAAIVVCDGCGSGANSEVGARLGASIVSCAIGRRLTSGELPSALWPAVRADVGRALAALLEQMGGDRSVAIHEHFLFTIVAAAMTATEAAVWMLGDGAYSIGGRARVIGPFPDNQPPYLAYDLLGTEQPAHLEVSPPTTIVITTDGGAELDLAHFATARFVAHPDALRRHLTVLARTAERIDWQDRRVVRTPAVIQDDCAIAVLVPEAA